MAFYSYLGMIFAPIVRLVVVNSSYQEASASLNRINDMMRNPSGVPESPSPVISDRIREAIAFEHVFFSYDGRKDVLKDIHFSVRPGETVGIVGVSGSGKTTLMNLLLRFYDPTRGRICIDGHPLDGLSLEPYRSQLAVVLQDDYLFNDTVEANIRYGSFQASEDEVRQAAVLAQAHEFISQCDRGYQTVVGEAGVRLSSGQRQRIALARAFLRNPSVLILDEATSALDAMTENKIQAAVRSRFKSAAVFIVAHRFSTIMDADKIVVLDDGRIVETGDHNYLLKKNGYYSNLYLEQFKEKDKSRCTAA